MAGKDLTQGNITRQLVELAVPLMLGNILQQLYNTVDAFIIGRFCGREPYAAIGVAGTVMNLFVFAVVGFCTGLSVLFAQSYGRRDSAGFRRVHFASLLSGLGLTLAAGIGGQLLLPWLLRLIQTPPEITGDAMSYLRIILWGLPVTMLYNLYSAMLRSVGSARAALLFLAAAVLGNTALDVLFVAGLDWGTAGAAAATVLAQLLSAALSVFWLGRSAPELRLRREDCRVDRALLRRTLHYGSVTALHQSGLYIGKVLVQGAVNSGGVALITAYTTTTRIEGFANSFGDSGSAATSVIVAQNVGAGKSERVRSAYRRSMLLLFLLGLVSAAVMYGGAGVFVTWLLGEESGAAWESAVSYLHLVALFYPLCFTGNTFAGYYDGCGRVEIPAIGAISHISLRVLLSWLLVGRMGLDAVALATGLGWILVNIMWLLYKVLFMDRASHRPRNVLH